MDAPRAANEKGAIRFIHTEAPGETYKEIRDFYFKGGSLICAYYAKHTYNAPYYLDAKRAREEGCVAYDPKKTVVKEERFYFSNEKMVEWIGINNKPVAKSAKEWESTEQDRLNFAKELLGIFRQ